MLIPVLSPEQAEAWDARAEASGRPRATLMEAAGRAAATVIARRHAPVLARGVVVAAGTGNNGGDGWVVARALRSAGIPVWVASLAGERSALCRAQAGWARDDGVRELDPDGPWPSVGLAVDAILGTGARGAPRPAAAALLERIADLRVPVIALDGPTGLDLATGVVHGSARADLSVTFGGVRRGHLLARDEAGEVVVVDIGHPAPDPAWPGLISDSWAAARVSDFPAATHKGDRGRVVILGGEPGMSGAIRLAARAAFASGAGLVHAVAPPDTVAALRTAEPDLQTTAQPFDGPLSADARALLERADVAVIGPGLGRAEGRERLVAEAASLCRRVVLDADGLTAFQGRDGDLARLARGRVLVLTPHPGEFRTLFPDLASGRETDPWTAARAAARRVEGVVLLKGVPTVVAAAEGPVLTVAAGNPGLATGGSGDVLSGITAVMLHQLRDPVSAAAAAAQALGRAGDAAARRVTARAARPMDVVAALPDVWRSWDATRRAPPGAEVPVVAMLPAPAFMQS